MDAGCGTGGLLSFLKQRGFQHLRGFDVSPHAVRICKNLGLTVEQQDMRYWHPNVEQEQADVIISNDTLYFLTQEEQDALMNIFWKVLTPGGLLIMNLPALSAFRGIHDISVGIHHRFSKEDVIRLLTQSHFERILLRYWPFFLSPVLYGIRLSQRVRLRCSPHCKIESDVHLPPSFMNRLLETLTRLEDAMQLPTPFGSSLFVVARKQAR